MSLDLLLPTKNMPPSYVTNALKNIRKTISYLPLECLYSLVCTLCQSMLYPNHIQPISDLSQTIVQVCFPLTNNMIDHSQVTGFPLDNVFHLGEMFLDVRCLIGNIPLTLWRSDIADAYCLLPMSPFWQLKQVITVDSEHFVNHNLAFGSSGSPGIFISFNSLVAWIAKNVKGINYISNYVNNSSGCNLQGDVIHYDPYNLNLLTHQVHLLQLWDDHGIPHKPHKQIFGAPLTILGIQVNPNHMTLTLPNKAWILLLDEICLWATKPAKLLSGNFKLKHWQHIAGWFNWALNVYALLHPALNNFYRKIGGKENREQQVYINNARQDDLSWAINYLKHSNSVHLLKSFTWTPNSTDFTIFCDTCPDGMGFWYLVSKDGYYAPTPVNVPSNIIFYFETLCALSALEHVQMKVKHGLKILIYADNSNTVDIFWTFHCLPSYNHLLKAAVDIIICNNYSLCVLHVPRDQNVVVNALSCIKFSIALEAVDMPTME